MTAPVVARSRDELAVARAGLSGRVAVVMTMGALHEGHAHLIRTAREAADAVLVTIFLNPLQFGAGEDLDRYPKTFDADFEICTREGVDLIFAPTPDVIYPDGDPGVRVSAGPLGDVLEGEHRPGHFDGVLTVVAKLLHLTAPDLAYFGEKDGQQLALITRMVHDLDFPVEIVAVPTVREQGGLALSSRNTYLSDSDRRAARSLNRALRAGAAAAAAQTTEHRVAATLAAARAVLADEPAVAVDYLALVDDDTWEDAGQGTTKGRLLVAARVGTTRLIDNVPVTFAGSGGHPTSAPDVG
jgi:pantoate--beta-alanine ligase